MLRFEDQAADHAPGAEFVMFQFPFGVRLEYLCKNSSLLTYHSVHDFLSLLNHHSVFVTIINELSKQLLLPLLFSNRRFRSLSIEPTD